MDQARYEAGRRQWEAMTDAEREYVLDIIEGSKRACRFEQLGAALEANRANARAFADDFERKLNQRGAD